jgi:hypothetical protein
MARTTSHHELDPASEQQPVRVDHRRQLRPSSRRIPRLAARALVPEAPQRCSTRSRMSSCRSVLVSCRRMSLAAAETRRWSQSSVIQRSPFDHGCAAGRRPDRRHGSTGTRWSYRGGRNPATHSISGPSVPAAATARVIRASDLVAPGGQIRHLVCSLTAGPSASWHSTCPSCLRSNSTPIGPTPRRLGLRHT